MIFFEDSITLQAWKPIGMLLHGFVSIVVIYAFFYIYQDWFSEKRKFGHYAQLVGRRTLDVYMIHYFLLPPKLNMLGVFFTETVNPIFEFVITTFFVLIVITLSILVGRIIRLSPTFSHYLLGTNIK